jgi:hypothetical protein
MAVDPAARRNLLLASSTVLGRPPRKTHSASYA